MIFVFEDLLTHYSSVSQPFKGRGAHGNQIVGELVICRVKLQFLDSSFVDFKIFREHLKAAHLWSPEHWLGTTSLSYRTSVYYSCYWRSLSPLGELGYGLGPV